ncbi:MAG: DUF1667 domain-containing protein [Lachnospiraceae bacterium]|nr:DUF1667 domain-containing protein [Lachnospiraceae bacterium]
METRELNCIVCPMGCPITVTLENGEVTSVTGNTCPRGEKYAKQEVVAPIRSVTSTVKVLGGEWPTVACKTKTEIPKGKIFEVMDALKGVSVDAPVNIGDVIIENVAGTNVNIIATSNVKAC